MTITTRRLDRFMRGFLMALLCMSVWLVPRPSYGDVDPTGEQTILAATLESEDPITKPPQPATYNVSLMGNGGTTPAGAPTITLEGLVDGYTYELPELPFQREGFEFVGWSHTQELGEGEEPLADGAWFDGSASAQFGGSGQYWAQWAAKDDDGLGFLDTLVGYDPSKRIPLAQRMLKAIVPGSAVTVQYVREVDFGFRGWTNERNVISGGNWGKCFCVNNGLRGPHFDYTAATGAVPGNVDGAKAALWFGYGGPGEADGNEFWPQTDYRGSAMSEADRIGYTHIVLNYFVRGELPPSDKASPYANMTAAERNWVKANLTSGANTTAQKMLAAKDRVSPQFEIVLIGSAQAGYQELVGWAASGFGDIRLTKQSANPTATANNPNYSLSGALYNVYGANGTTGTNTYIKTDASGVGRLYRWGTSTRTKLEAGTYIIKEYSASKGYALDAKSKTVVVTSNGRATVSSVEPLLEGSLELTKVSSVPSLTTGNPCYSLEGASYAICSDSSCTAVVARLTTREDGSCETIRLPAGTYWIKETEASAGYLLDPDIHQLTISAGTTTVFTTKEPPRVDRPDLLVRKLDAQSATPVPQGDASLAGAQFTVEFYPAFCDSLDDLPPLPARRWVFETDDAGEVHFTSEYLVSGDSLYLSDDGATLLPLGSIRIRETKAPEGYRLADGFDSLQCIDPDDAQPQAETCLAPLTVEECVTHGGLQVKKEGEDGSPLAGAIFAIANASANPIVIGGSTYAPGETCLRITSDGAGIAQTGADALPYGRYVVTEAEAPRGYATNGDWSIEATIKDDATVIDLTSEPCQNSRITIPVVLEAQKRFDGTAQGRTLEAGMFSFTLSDNEGTVLQTKGNDAQGKVTFDPISYDFRDLGAHTYHIAEIEGDDEEVIYDTHDETVSVSIEAPDDHTLTSRITTDEDGVLFDNATVPRINTPRTGGPGVKGATAGSALVLTAVGALGARRRNRL